MKKVILSLFVVFSLLIYSSCGGMETKFKMRAVVRDVNEYIEVEVVDSEYADGIYWVRLSNECKYYVGDKEIDSFELSVGDEIEIMYSGQVMMSYPPQIVAKEIRKK